MESWECDFRYKQVENIKLDIQTRIIIGAIGITALLIMALISSEHLFEIYTKSSQKGGK